MVAQGRAWPSAFGGDADAVMQASQAAVRAGKRGSFAREVISPQHFFNRFNRILRFGARLKYPIPAREHIVYKYD